MTAIAISLVIAAFLSYFLYLFWYSSIAYIFVFLLLFIAAAVFYFRRDKIYLLFTMLSLYPLATSLGPVNQMPMILLLGPILTAFILFSVVIQGEAIFKKETTPFLVAIAIVVLWVLYGYLKEPFQFTMDNKIILKDYLAFFSGIIIFFFSLLYFKKYRVDEGNFLRFIILSAALFSFLRFLTFFSGFRLPFFGEEFMYHETGGESAAAGIHRIGGIDRCCALAVPAILAYFPTQRRKYLFLLPFMGLAVAGGGRTIFFSLLGLLFIYLLIFEKKAVGFYLLSLTTILVTSMALLNVSLPAQFSRIFKVKHLFLEDELRVSTYEYYIDIFLRHPIFGKGIRPYTEFFSGDPFVDKQLVSGGHGAYLSILAILGLGGLFFLLTFLGWGIFKSYRLLRRRQAAGSWQYPDRITVFIFLSLVLIALACLTGRNGYADPNLYYCVGTLCGILLRKPALQGRPA